eukprot:237998_1
MNWFKSLLMMFQRLRALHHIRFGYLQKNNWCCVRSMVDNSEYDKLCQGDSVLSLRGKCLTISNIEYKYIDIEQYEDVYTLHIEGVHNFFVEGILVHNAMQIYVKKQYEPQSKPIVLDVQPNDKIYTVKKKNI